MKIFRQQIDLWADCIDVPSGAKVLSVAPARHVTDGLIDVWYTVSDVDNPVETYPLTILGTGHQFSIKILEQDFIGTCVMPSGLVWHIFVGNPK